MAQGAPVRIKVADCLRVLRTPNGPGDTGKRDKCSWNIMNVAADCCPCHAGGAMCRSALQIFVVVGRRDGA